MKYDVAFIKQAHVNPRDRLKKLAAKEEEVRFIKQVPVLPRDRLKKKKEKGNLLIKPN